MNKTNFAKGDFYEEIKKIFQLNDSYDDGGIMCSKYQFISELLCFL